MRGLTLAALAAAAVAVLAIGFVAAADPPKVDAFPSPALADYFVTIEGGQFVLGCNVFPVSGFNEWEVIEAGAGVSPLPGSKLPPGVTGPALLRKKLDLAAAAGMTVMRAWAHGVTAEMNTIGPDGQLVEGLMAGLDYAISEAGKRGIKVVLSWASNWTPAGSPDAYAAALGLPREAFFTDPAVKNKYKNYIAAVVARRNTVTGRVYGEDPTIMAFNLINEPVCRNCPPGTIAAWVREMAAYAKSLGIRQLLTVGEEGFYSTTAAALPANPGAWAAEYTQDFVADHAPAEIDYMSIHGWPNLWSSQTPEWFRGWIRAHAAHAAAAGKPLVLEEFGAEGGGRQAYYQVAFEEAEASLAAGGPLKGALWWQWYAAGQDASDGEGGGAGRFGVRETDGTFELIRAHTAAVARAAAGGTVGVCSPAGAPAAGADCPPGFEGVGCAVDVNECARGLDGCRAGTTCINTPGSFECICPVGSAGGPDACVPDEAALAAAAARFWNDPAGMSCDTGVNVVYPKNAPGYAEDPAGMFERREGQAGGFGARRPVSLGECSAACLAAEGCTMFVYNEVTRGCFLKSGACPLRNSCQAPRETCRFVNDMGKEIATDCGTWTSYYRQEIKDGAEAYCATIPAQVTAASPSN